MNIKSRKLKIKPFGGNNGFKNKQIEQFMQDGGNTGKLYQIAIINKFRFKDMTETIGSNAPFDSQRLDKNGNLINQEIRTLSKSGIYWGEARYAGSKANDMTKLKSTHKKLEILGDSGEFVIYDNTKWTLKNQYVDVYTINVKDWKYHFGKLTFKSSYSDMMKFLKKQ